VNLDHVFICVENPAAAEQVLADFGLMFGLHAVHPGQGTANACAFFDNAYLELLWRRDDDELRSEVVRPLALSERVRWRETGASPFGVALQPGDEEIAVETWPYHALFLPAGATIPIVTRPHTPDAPLVFLIPRTLPIRIRTPSQPI
jgi:Glyoxalase-like domain